MATEDPSADPAPAGLREAKKARTRSGLARAALQLVAEEGLHATTVEAIAARADVSPRTFFNYFDSKDEAVVHLGADRFRRLMLRLFADTTEATAPAANPVLRIRDVMLDFLRESESDPDASADDDLVREALERDPSLFGTLHTSMAAVGAEFEAALTAHYASVADRDLARVGLSVALGLTQTAMQSARAGLTDAPLTELVAHYFDLLQTAFTDERPLP
ncbi:hypothetical protein C3V38_07220 [Dietzia sp. oral taxon 368]|uniref:TetR/AcrR family transcriptional regulator n=1 Tax=Dietzia sp. oral taxon 368 TaxID=712270 RepID=UPI000D092FF2|nr:TetR/AcrR family transcriptional regulator [Dietzia sp. oral taxon 368]AVM64216.1 hypothetical protein C3V38_07220 [Dietzia sp. oral taxon 368]